MTSGREERYDLVRGRREGGGRVVFIGVAEALLFQLLLQGGGVDEIVREEVAGRSCVRVCARVCACLCVCMCENVSA